MRSKRHSIWLEVGLQNLGGGVQHCSATSFKEIQINIICTMQYDTRI